jgi:hypothetical protein
MIVTLKRSSNAGDIKEVVRWLGRQGFDVQISKGRKVLIAALGAGFDKVTIKKARRLKGSIGVQKSNLPFTSQPKKFQEAWIFLLSREGC